MHRQPGRRRRSPGDLYPRITHLVLLVAAFLQGFFVPALQDARQQGQIPARNLGHGEQAMRVSLIARPRLARPAGHQLLQRWRGGVP